MRFAVEEEEFEQAAALKKQLKALEPKIKDSSAEFKTCLDGITESDSLRTVLSNIIDWDEEAASACFKVARSTHSIASVLACLLIREGLKYDSLEKRLQPFISATIPQLQTALDRIA